MQIASHNPNIIIQSIQPKHHKIFKKNKKGGFVQGNRRFPGLKGGGVRGNRRFPGIYLQCGGLKNKICIFIINNGSH